jgi:hypothetical protein
MEAIHHVFAALFVFSQHDEGGGECASFAMVITS